VPSATLLTLALSMDILRVKRWSPKRRSPGEERIRIGSIERSPQGSQ